jgi:uncharacterized protein (DUF1697 family)
LLHCFAMRFVALLRGINVGGNSKISMPELRQLFEELGYGNVNSYINSGNVAFDATGIKPRVSGPQGRKGPARNESFLVNEIEQAIERHFKLPIQVMVREQTAVGHILGNNPYEGEFESHREMHVLFMKGEMPEEKQAQLLEKQTENERFAVRGREIYCHLRLGVADSLLGKGFIEKKLKVPITARNWRTIQKLAEM